MPTLTLSDIQSSTLSRLDNNTLLYPTAELTAYANEVLKIINNLTGFIQTSVLVPTSSVSNRVWYDVPSPLLVSFKVQVEGRYLQRHSISRMGQLYPRWTKETTDNTSSQVCRWIPVGLTKFGIHPADSQGGKDILVTGISEPTVLVSGSDILPIPNDYISAIEDLMVFTAQIKEGYPLFQGAAILYTNFLSRMKEQKRWRNMSMPAFYVEREQSK